MANRSSLSLAELSETPLIAMFEELRRSFTNTDVFSHEKGSEVFQVKQYEGSTATQETCHQLPKGASIFLPQSPSIVFAGVMQQVVDRAWVEYYQWQMSSMQQVVLFIAEKASEVGDSSLATNADLKARPRPSQHRPDFDPKNLHYRALLYSNRMIYIRFKG